MTNVIVYLPANVHPEAFLTTVHCSMTALVRYTVSMNIYFSGIGGVAIGPLSEIALDAGYEVQGSDQKSNLVTERLVSRGVNISIGEQDGSFLKKCHLNKPIDWFIYTAALPKDHPEILKAQELGIKTAKRDELISHIITEKNLKLIAIAGTHGKTTTTGMVVWLTKYFGIPVSYSIGTTIPWGPSGYYNPKSEYFIYECDEFDRNLLHFQPYVSLITSLDYDHPDTYLTREDYNSAFSQFVDQSEKVFTWRTYEPILGSDDHITYLEEIDLSLKLRGEHNRRNASLILAALESFSLPTKYAADGLNKFPGTDRRFEKLADGIYSDYGHTPAEIEATLQMAKEFSDDITLVYQPHQNARQHTIKDQYKDTFLKAEKIYWLPTYFSREDRNLATLTPEELIAGIANREAIEIADLNDELWQNIIRAREEGKLVLIMGAGSIDGWARERLKS